MCNCMFHGTFLHEVYYFQINANANLEFQTKWSTSNKNGVLYVIAKICRLCDTDLYGPKHAAALEMNIIVIIRYILFDINQLQ